LGSSDGGVPEDGQEVVESDDQEGVFDMFKKEISEKGEDILEKEDCKDVSDVTKEKVEREVHRRV